MVEFTNKPNVFSSDLDVDIVGLLFDHKLRLKTQKTSRTSSPMKGGQLDTFRSENTNESPRKGDRSVPRMQSKFQITFIVTAKKTESAESNSSNNENDVIIINSESEEEIKNEIPEEMIWFKLPIEISEFPQDLSL
jgi:hypothetical protein